MQYAALLAQDLSVQHAMMSALLLLGRPFLLGIFAVRGACRALRRGVRVAHPARTRG